MRLTVRRKDWAFSKPFRISYDVKLHAETIVVQLDDGQNFGRGEGLAVFYLGETADGIRDQVEDVRSTLERGITNEELLELLPAGGARNAVDCALWDFEAKRSGRRVWDLLGLDAPHEIETCVTLGLDTPDVMADDARTTGQCRKLKVKLGGAGDIERIAAIREARPDAELIVDANQAWNAQQLHRFVPELARLGVTLIEQPMPAGKDDALADYDSPIPLCADESCQTSASLPGLAGKYDLINIKLDKAGGLTEALRLADAATAAGFGLMVGCMSGSSLSMAPAFLVGQRCAFVDLDGPLLLSGDVPDPIRYTAGLMAAPDRALWG